MKKPIILSLLLTSLFTVYAGTIGENIGGLVNDVTKNIITAIGYFFLTSAVAVFFYGMVRFIWDRRDGKDTKGDKSMMTWGILALFIMFSIWGIITFAQKTLSGNGTNLNQTTITVPQFQFLPGGSGGTTDPSPLGSYNNSWGGSASNVVPSPTTNSGVLRDSSGNPVTTSGGTTVNTGTASNVVPSPTTDTGSVTSSDTTYLEAYCRSQNMVYNPSTNGCDTPLP